MLKYVKRSLFVRSYNDSSKALSSIIRNLSSSSPETSHSQSIAEDPLGQPTGSSHPHLVKPGEVVSGIQLSEVIQRRSNLVKKILTSKAPSKNHIIIIPSQTTLYMSEDVPYVFRQDTDFRYLTGCLEPDVALMISINENGSFKSTLFTRERNKHTELWDGPRTGPDKAVSYFGVDESYPMLELKKVVTSKVHELGNYCLWYDFQHSNLHNLTETLSSIIPESKCQEVMNPEESIHSLRVIKSEAEQILMQKTCDIISNCFIYSMKNIKKLSSEHQVYALVDCEARMEGAEILAYPPVIAAGNNANIIHYIKNNQAFNSSDLLLMDAGSELHGYCSDVTRCWPVRGEFTDPQRTLYDIVLTVQEQCLKYLQDNRPSLDSVLEYMNEELYKRLAEAHVLTKAAHDQNPRVVSSKFCPHHVGHYLGMDVHDTATVPRKKPVSQGMVVTIEPGAYIRQSNDFAKEEFKGIGIRIEDDVLITDNGIQILSNKCPKTTSQIEQLCNN